jgi:hypothetical protein
MAHLSEYDFALSSAFLKNEKNDYIKYKCTMLKSDV